MTDALVPAVPVVATLQPYEAILNVTWSGQNGNLVDPIAFDASDIDIKAWASEAVSSGSIPGIRTATANFGDFVVERFAATADNAVNRVVVRPKTPFGD